MKYVISFLFLFIALWTSGQDVKLNLVTFSGGSYVGEEVLLDWSLGETVVENQKVIKVTGSIWALTELDDMLGDGCDFHWEINGITVKFDKEGKKKIKISKHSILLNPARDFVTVKGVKGSSHITIFNSNGRKVKALTGDDSGFSVSELSKGNYFVRIVTADHAETKVLSVQ